MNQSGQEFYVGRIELRPGYVIGTLNDPLARPAKTPGYTVEKPIRTYDEFFAAARALKPPEMYWLVEVKFDSDERAPRYFTGECEPRWQGVTTIRVDLAQKYSSKEAAEKDIAILAPRLIGEWVAREHGFS